MGLVQVATAGIVARTYAKTENLALLQHASRIGQQLIAPGCGIEVCENRLRRFGPQAKAARSRFAWLELKSTHCHDQKTGSRD